MTPTHSPTLRCPSCKYDVSQTLRNAITTCPECGQAIGYDRLHKSHPVFPIATSATAIIAWLFLPSLVYGIALTFPAFFERAPLRHSTPRVLQAIEFIVLGACCVGTPLLVISLILWSANLYHAMLGDRDEVNPWLFLTALLAGLTLSLSLVITMFNIW